MKGESMRSLELIKEHLWIFRLQNNLYPFRTNDGHRHLPIDSIYKYSVVIHSV